MKSKSSKYCSIHVIVNQFFPTRKHNETKLYRETERLNLSNSWKIA